MSQFGVTNMESSPSAASTASFEPLNASNLRDIPTGLLLAELKSRYGKMVNKRQKRVIFVGAAGCGKGTQSAVVKDHFEIAHLSTGDMLREAVAAKTPLGLKAKEIMEKGELIGDDIVLGLVKDRISSPACKNGFILDGFPRNVSQAAAFDALDVVKSEPVDAVIYMEVPDSVLIERVCGRRIHVKSNRIYHVTFRPPKVEGLDDVTGEPLTHRKDDTIETLMNRLEIFKRETLPLIEYYGKQGILHVIDCRLSPSEVTSTVMAILGDFNYALSG